MNARASRSLARTVREPTARVSVGSSPTSERAMMPQHHRPHDAGSEDPAYTVSGSDPLIYSTSSLVKASSGSTKYSISRSSSSSSGDGGGGGGGSSAGMRTFR